MKFHPLSELLPLLDGAAFEELTADVREHGVRTPIVMHEGQILDGRNRYRAFVAAGIAGEPPQRVLTPGEGAPLDYVISANLHRRQLSESQRAMVAAKIAQLKGGRPAMGAASTVSQPQAAALMNVSRASVQRGKKVLEQAAPEVVAAVERGEVRVGVAEKLTHAPREAQAAAVAAGPKAVKRLARQVAAKTPTPVRAHATARPVGSIVAEFLTLKPRQVLQLPNARALVTRLILLTGALREAFTKKHPPKLTNARRAKAAPKKRAAKKMHAARVH